MNSRRYFVRSCFGIFASGAVCVTALAEDKKWSEDDRIEVLRGLSAEYAIVKDFLPRSRKPLPFESTGNYDKQRWAEIGKQMGPAARVGDQVQITHVSIEPTSIVLEINNGFKSGGHWYDHVQGGMGGPMSGTTMSQPGYPGNAAGGTYIALIFGGRVPVVTSADIKKMLAPILDFDKHSAASESYVELLPEPIKKAIKSNKVIVGMDREQVLLAMGKPRHKERGLKDGDETEDWVYGFPPGKITFVTFNGSKVAKVNEAYADIGGSTANPLPAH